MPPPETVVTPIVDLLIGLGLPGVVIAVLLWICWTLFGKYQEAQEARISEGLKNQERLHEAIMALKELRGGK